MQVVFMCCTNVVSNSVLFSSTTTKAKIFVHENSHFDMEELIVKSWKKKDVAREHMKMFQLRYSEFTKGVYNIH